MRPWAVLVTVLGCAGCAVFSDVLNGTLQNPTITFVSARLDSVTLDSATVVGTFRVDNPNAFSVSLGNVDFGVTLDSQKLFDGSVPNGLDLPASGAVQLPVAIQIPFKALPGLLTTLVNKTEAPYQVAGHVAVHTPISDITLPIAWSGVVPIPSLPKLSLSGARVDSLSLSGARIILTLAVDNPNAFALPLESLGASLSIGDQSVAQIAVEAAQALGAKQTTSVELPVSVSFLQSGLGLARTLGSGGATYRVQGGAKVAGHTLPLDLSGTLR
jgi:LEA14-like dessication related protein